MKTVLVVDDEESIRTILEMALEREGYNVLLAENSAEGIHLVQNNNIDLVITDIQMPGMTGNQLTKQIKSIYNIPIIGISGTPWFFNESLFDCTFTKPFRIKDLFDKVRELLV